MFKKRKKQAADVAPIATSHPLFDFSVIDGGMRDAVRDYSALKAYAAVQTKAAAPTPVPVPIVPPPAPAPAVPVPAKKKKPLVSRFVLLSGFFIILAAALGGGALLWSLRSNNTPTTPVAVTPPVTTPPVTTPPVTTPPVEAPTRFDTQGKDTDSDGLTDSEERLFGTDIRNPDTDGDTYLDNNEVFHGYDPTKPSPAPLSLSEHVKTYVFDGMPRFSFLKLNSWSVEAPNIVPDGSHGSIRLLTSSGSEFRFTIQERNKGQTIGDWYDASTWRTTYGLFTSLQSFVSKQGYVGRITDDKRVAFLDLGAYTAIMEYDLKTERTTEYSQTFQMMINSFVLLP